MFGFWSKPTESTTGKPPSAVVPDSGTIIIAPKGPVVPIPLDSNHDNPENSKPCSEGYCTPIGPLTVTSSKSNSVGGGRELAAPVVTSICKDSGGNYHIEVHHVELHNIKQNGLFLQQGIGSAHNTISEGVAGKTKQSDMTKHKEKAQLEYINPWIAAIAPIVANIPAAASNVRAYF